MPPAHCKIKMDANGLGKIWVDDHDLSQFVTGLRIDSRPGVGTRLYVELLADVEFEGAVVSEDLQRTLAIQAEQRTARDLAETLGGPRSINMEGL